MVGIRNECRGKKQNFVLFVKLLKIWISHDNLAKINDF